MEQFLLLKMELNGHNKNLEHGKNLMGQYMETMNLLQLGKKVQFLLLRMELFGQLENQEQ